MNYEEWEKSVPTSITSDSLWKMTAYRLALFIRDIGWFDVTKLLRDRRTVNVAGQLYEALGSISANLAEGYSRGTGKDRARFYEYSLGSARESRDWYYGGRHVLGDAVVQHRMQFLSRVASLLLVMVPDQRGRTLREDPALYFAETDEFLSDNLTDPSEFDELLMNIPLPDDV
jgi:four helix bundle protein